MYSEGPMAISDVKIFRALFVSVVLTFWAAFFTFFFAPIWTCGVCFVLHVMVLVLYLNHSCQLIVSFVRALAGKGVPAAAPKLGAGAGAPGSMESEAESDSDP